MDEVCPNQSIALKLDTCVSSRGTGGGCASVVVLTVLHVDGYGFGLLEQGVLGCAEHLLGGIRVESNLVVELCVTRHTLDVAVHSFVPPFLSCANVHLDTAREVAITL